MPDKDLEASLLAHTDSAYPPSDPLRSRGATSNRYNLAALPSGPLSKAVLALFVVLLSFSAGRHTRPHQPFLPSSSNPPSGPLIDEAVLEGLRVRCCPFFPVVLFS
jgi:hypothetical protein